MDKISKALRKLSDRERELIKSMLLAIETGQFVAIDIKKLKGRDNVYRARKGNLRIIFIKNKDGGYNILAIERRSDVTYRKY